MARTITKRREQVLNQILETLGIPTSGPVAGVEYKTWKAAIALVNQKRMTRNMLDSIEMLFMEMDTMFAS